MYALQWHQDGLAPYISFEGRSDHGDAEIGAAQQWLSSHFSVANPVEEMIKQSTLAERTFKRRFTAATGLAPIAPTQFVQLANQTDTPLLFLHNTTGYMVGKDYEQGGIIKHGAQMINAVSNSTVPHLSVIMGASYGAGNYGMNGRAFDPRFLFTWPSAKSAVMGPAQLAGVLEIVAQQSAESKGEVFDAEGFKGVKDYVEASVEEQSLPYFLSGMLYDDGVIDPRDTRTVLGMALSAVHSNEVRGRRGFGVFRM